MKKYIIPLLTIFILLATSGISPLYAEEHSDDNDSEDQETNDSLNLAENSKSALLLERDTGKIIYEKNAHEQLPPASMTKIMTLLLIMEALDKEKITLEEKVRVSEYAASMGGSQIFLEAGEEMSVEDLLKGVAVASGNDASVALAERISGSEEAFVMEMNNKAKQLGLENTQFQNTTGLPAENHFSTAYDMGLMAKELLKYEDITKYTSIYDDYLRKGSEDEFWLVNTNKLVKSYDGVDGLKTGYTSKAKYCLTATAQKDNMRTIAVVLGAETTKDRNNDVTQMLDYAFTHFSTNQLFKSEQPVSKLNLIKADKNDVDIVTDQSVSVIHEKGEELSNVKTNVKIDQDIELPLKKGDQVGKLEVTIDGETISETPLIVNDAVDKAGLWSLFKRSMNQMVKKD